MMLSNNIRVRNVMRAPVHVGRGGHMGGVRGAREGHMGGAQGACGRHAGGTQGLGA